MSNKMSNTKARRARVTKNVQKASAHTFNIILFGSNATPPFHRLSNFHLALIKLNVHDLTPAMETVCPKLQVFLRAHSGRVIYPTSEHFWQSLKAQSLKAFSAFVMDGDGLLARWDLATFMRFYPNQEKAASKLAYWSKKHNRGILAKLAAKPKRAKLLGWKQGEDMDYEREHLDADLERQVWLDILKMKYQQNEGPRKVLLEDTAGKRLVEMARKPTDHWGGMVNHETGEIRGFNAMGQYNEAVRALLSV